MFEINLIFYGLSSTLQFSQFVWPLSYSVWDVFNNFLLIDATDRRKISRDQKRFFIALSLYPLSFFANTHFNLISEGYNTVKIAFWNTLCIFRYIRLYVCRNTCMHVCMSIGVYEYLPMYLLWWEPYPLILNQISGRQAIQ